MSKHGENIWKRKDGRWEARYIKGRNSAGKALYGSVYAKSYSEVKKKREGIINYIMDYPISSCSSKTMEYVISEYMNEHKFEVKESTYVRYMDIAAKHLIPDLGSMDISKFTQEVGDCYIKKLLINGKNDGTGLAPKTVKDIISVLKLVLKYAKAKNYIANVPIELNVPRQGRTSIQIFAPDQQKRLENFVCSTTDSYKFGVYLCLYTGLRLGEICALQWKDVDSTNLVISINKTILRVKNVNSAVSPKTRLLINSPKTPSSERIIPLPETLNSMMQTLKAEMLPSENCYVLTGTEKFIEPRNYYERYKGYLRSCNLDGFNFHTLRHTFATRCIEIGVDPKVLSEILGHASVQITLDRYVHPSMAIKRTSLDRLFKM